jgi:transposase
MFLKKTKSRGKTFLSFVEGYRVNGIVKQKTVEKIGYLEDYLDIYDDPIAHFKQVAKERNEANKEPSSIDINVSAKLDDNTDNRKNLGYAIVKDIYAKLDLRSFFQDKQRHLNIDYNLNSIFSLLVYNRFLFPSSKKKAYDTKHQFFDRFDFSLDDVYRSLDYFNKYSNQLQQYLHQQVCNLIGRDNELAYYDVTNYYFEIPYNDEDEYDENGDITKKGQRKKGVSKEHRKTPIVQMGLLMDTNGIPMAYHTFPGNESEKNNLLPNIRRVKRDFELNRVIVVADRGLNTSDNMAYLSGKNHDDMKNNDGYVYGQSVLGGTDEFKKWVISRDGYQVDKFVDEHGEKITFTHKSRIFAKKITLKGSDGKRNKTIEIYQKQMAYYSKKYAEKQRKDREKMLNKAKDLIANPGRYNKSTSYGAADYINNIKFVKETGEISDGQALSLNVEKIKEQEKYDGFYSIVTSEKHLTDKEIHDTYKGLWKIEESFKIIKSEFKTRPVYVKLDEHINGHFLVCFVTLLIMRTLEHLIDKKHSVKEIRETLIKYSCSYLEKNYYLFDFRNDVIKTFEKVFDFDFSKKIMTLSEIKNILKYEK